MMSRYHILDKHTIIEMFYTSKWIFFVTAHLAVVIML